MKKVLEEFKKNRTTCLHRLMNLGAMITLIIATVMTLVIPPDVRTFIPHPEITAPIIYCVSAVFCFVLVVVPDKYFFESFVLFIQSFFTVWTGQEIIGIFLYFVMIVLLFCNSFFKTHTRKKILILIFLWLLIVSGVGMYGRHRVILTYITTFLYFLFSYYVFFLLKDMLKPLLPNIINTTRKDLPEFGSEVSLSQFNLSKRKEQFISDFIVHDLKYAAIAKKRITSTSVVKKEMAEVLKFFGVRTNNELRILFKHYTLIEEGDTKNE